MYNLPQVELFVCIAMSLHSLKDRVLVFGTSDGGSIPSGGTGNVGIRARSSTVEQFPLKELVESSNLSELT